MSLVARAVELPVPCPSPARVGSQGPIHFLLEKERPTDHEPHSNRAKSTKEFANVCRQAVSVSCGQPLLSYKPKRSKPAKPSKSLEISKVLMSTMAKEPDLVPVSEKSMRCSVSSKVLANAIRLSGCSEVSPDMEFNRDPQRASLRTKEGFQGSIRRSLPHEDGYEIKKSPEQEEPTRQADYPVFQRSVSPINLSLDDYHKALIPFLRNELDAAGKLSKRRHNVQSSQMTGLHRRTTSLGNCAAPSSEQKVWQPHKRDSYPPFSQPKNLSFFRLSPSADHTYKNACYAGRA